MVLIKIAKWIVIAIKKKEII